MSRQELIDAFSLEGINRANAVINFKEPAETIEDTFDPKALWLNAEHIRALPVEQLSERLLPLVRAAGHDVSSERMLKITPLVRERIRLLNEALCVADFFFMPAIAALRYGGVDSAEGRRGYGRRLLKRPARVLAKTGFTHDALDACTARGRQRFGHQSRADVPAHSRGGVRAQERAAAV